MWITADVNIPQQLLDAAAKDEVVFFVGAGASFNPPANLPSYNQLAAMLADEADESRPCDDEQLDRFIGMLPDNFNVHKRTKDIMRGDDIHCNSTHEAIVRLASSVKTPRIVTTNYDLLLEEAAQKQNCDLGRSYYGPAVPIGSDFSGLLYLHGSVDSPDREIVLDDRDFARAYLSEGWATRFLLKLFETYTVVFIGYSFGDVIMRYLALGISSHARPRYIFLSEEEARENAAGWKHSGVIPISYPVENNHQALVIALNAWSDRLLLNYDAYRKFLPSIIENGVPKDKVNSDYVREALTTDEGARAFVDVISQEEKRIEVVEKGEKEKGGVKGKKEEWLFWLLNENRFRIIFVEGEPKTSSEKILLDWFIADFVEKAEERDCVLRVLCELQSSMSDYLFNQLIQIVGFGIQNGREDLVPVFAVLSTSIQQHSAPYIFENQYNFLAADKPIISEKMLSLIIRPYLKLFSSPWDKDGKPTANIMWPCNGLFGINDEEKLNSNITAAFAEDGLKKASELLCSYQEHDEISHLDRPSIEPSDQNWRPSDLTSTFVDILRNYAHCHPEQEDVLIERWWNSGSALLKRLTINAIAFSEVWDADRKIQWILDRDYLFDSDAHHEIYTLLKQASPQIGQNTKQKLLLYLKGKYDYLLELFSDERIARYEQYDVLQWILKYGDNWPEAQHWCDVLARENGFKPREHSDFSVYHYSGSVESAGISNEQFIEINAVSGFLNEQINHEKNDISQKSLQVMDCLASQLWAKYSPTFKKSNERQWDNDPVTYSLNCWPGELAYFWIGRIRWRYNQDPDFWSGFDDSEKSVIRHFVDDEGDFSRPVWTALLTYINMLHFLDRENTESWLPNLVEKAGADFIWNVLLPYPDLNNRLISLAFYASCLDEFECLSHLDVYKRQGFFLQVFRMATYAELDEEQRVRLLSKVMTAGDGVYAALFMDQVAWAFEFRLDSKDKDMVWDLWLHQFIEDRHAGKGRNWSEKERIAFAKLIPLLDEHFAEGVQYLSDSFPKIADHDFNELIMIDNFDNIPLKNERACIDFYSLLIKRHGDGPVWGVQELLQKLSNRFGFDEVVPLVSLAKQKRMISNTWVLFPKKEMHGGGKEGEA